MDFHLKQWSNHQLETSEHQDSSKIPKLLISTHEQQQEADPSGSALPLFVSEPCSKISTLSALPDSSSASTRYLSTGSYFSLSQWQELELQALIFRYMLAGSSVPPELLQPIKKSLLQSPSFFLHQPTLQHYSAYQPDLFQTGYWGRGAMDPEPGRCRRTDGKKWRCSRDIVSGHKYCERHMYRGRNRSRKPVEIPTAPSSSSSGVIASSSSGNAIAATNLNSNPSATASGGTHFALSASIHQIQLNQSTSETKTENKDLFEPQNKGSGDGNSNGHILRHFFDDWPRSLQESDNGGSSMSSATCLSMSTPENSSSDVSLKLFTGNADHDLTQSEHKNHRLSWAAGWPSNRMGGPLAEALRSSNSNASPTSVLNQLACGSVSEISFVSA